MAVDRQIQLSVKNLSCAFDGVLALVDLSFDVMSGVIVALIGPNGAGKTTAFNIFSGFLSANEGDVTLAGRSIIGRRPEVIARLGLGRTFQDCKVFQQVSVLDNVLLGFRDQSSETLWRALIKGTTLKKSENDKKARALSLLKEAGLIEKMDSPACDLSYGQRKLLELCRVRALDPKVFVLDEPFAGLFPSIAAKMADMIKNLRDDGRTVIFIEHDMNVVADLAERVIVLDLGQLIADGTPQLVLKDPNVLNAYLGRKVEGAS